MRNQISTTPTNVRHTRRRRIHNRPDCCGDVRRLCAARRDINRVQVQVPGALDNVGIVVTVCGQRARTAATAAIHVKLVARCTDTTQARRQNHVLIGQNVGKAVACGVRAVGVSRRGDVHRVKNVGFSLQRHRTTVRKNVTDIHIAVLFDDVDVTFSRCRQKAVAGVRTVAVCLNFQGICVLTDGARRCCEPDIVGLDVHKIGAKRIINRARRN